MVFEQAYGRWLVAELNARIQKINDKLICKQHDEVGYKPLYDDPNEIAVVISGGNATRSQVKGQDQNALPLSVTIICKENYSTPVRNAVDSLQRDFNAVPTGLTFYDALATTKKLTVKCKAVFTTPLVFDESDFKTRNETIKAAFLSFSATILYGVNAVVEPAAVTLKIDGKSYSLKHIAECNRASLPNYESYLSQGADRAEQIGTSRANAFSFTVYKVDGDELQQIFDDELACRSGLNGKNITLNFGGGDIAIRTYQLNDQYVNNAAAYNLTLGL